MTTEPKPEEILRALRCTKSENSQCASCSYRVMYKGLHDYCDTEKLECDAASLIESLQAQLLESQRREKAAVNDMIPRRAICKHGNSCNFISDFTGRHDCMACDKFEWRGPQEAGKGEAE